MKSTGSTDLLEAPRSMVTGLDEVALLNELIASHRETLSTLRHDLETVRAKISSAVPDQETGDVSMLVTVKNGRISNPEFNPNNPDSHGQLEMDYDDES